MERVSSSVTLVLKLFIPTFWIVFFGVFTLVVWLTNENIGFLNFISFKIGLTAFFLLGVLFLYFTLIQLKRVEMDKHFVYASNYFKTYRYPYHNIRQMKENDFLIFKTAQIILKEPGHFGRKIIFIVSPKNFQHFLKENPDVVIQLRAK